jgi:hypothetical protein
MTQIKSNYNNICENLGAPVDLREQGEQVILIKQNLARACGQLLETEL